MRKAFPFLIAVILLCITLFACTPANVKQPSDEEILTELLSNYEQNPCHKIEGQIFKNNELFAKVSATTNLQEKKISLNFNDKEYLYYGTYLVRKESDYVVDKSETNYLSTLNEFLPFVINNYVYDKDNRGELYRSENRIIVTFLNKGVKNSFASPLSVNAGYLSIGFDGKEITDTTLTTTVTENGVSYPLYCHYKYQTSDFTFNNLPWVCPTDTIGYAAYAMNTLSTLNVGKTLKTASGKRDTGVELSAIKVTNALVKNVTTIMLDNKNTTLIIDYTERQVIIGLSSSIQTFKIIYDENYTILSISINEGTTYVLE